MKVEAILKVKGRQVETIRPDERMAMAVHRLATLHIGALVVTGDTHRVEGIVAEREVVRGLSKHGAALLNMPVSALMSKGGPVCSPDDLIQQVMAQMTRTRNRHVPVVEAGQLAGLVSGQAPSRGDGDGGGYPPRHLHRRAVGSRSRATPTGA